MECSAEAVEPYFTWISSNKADLESISPKSLQVTVERSMNARDIKTFALIFSQIVIFQQSMIIYISKWKI